jgi:preprotein translocase subunit YajC
MNSSISMVINVCIKTQELRRLFMDPSAAPQGALGILGFLPMILVFVAMYFILILPQRKRDKKTREMLDSLRVGDRVTAIGGITGKIINIKDDEVTIETGVEKTKIDFKKWGIKEIDRPLEG